MLFDDRNYPYHTMLQNFVIYGGHDAFFDCFKMAFNQNNFGSNDLPDGVMEFLDSWLLLLEKLINPQTLMESPYCVSSKMKPSHRSRADYTLFDPIQYLIRTHRVRNLFGNIEWYPYGFYFTESISVHHGTMEQQTIQNQL